MSPLFEHQNKRPSIHESAYVAPNATICGDITIGENCRILFGAVLAAEGGPVVIGSQCIIMENAVIRGTPRHPTPHHPDRATSVIRGRGRRLARSCVDDNVRQLRSFRRRPSFFLQPLFGRPRACWRAPRGRFGSRRGLQPLSNLQLLRGDFGRDRE